MRLFPLLLLVAACAAPERPAEAPPASAPATEAPRAMRNAAPSDPARLVVAELFTSEGCSSCPPADALLADLAGRPDVLALSFHVDYWDRLGWRDPFSSAWATARQRAYARTLDGRSYTPELVVGGTVGFVGSRRSEARQRIAEAPAPSASVGVTARRAGGRVEAQVVTERAPAGSVVHVALVQREAVTNVARGENRGRTLRHANVVRAFETRPAGDGAPVSLTLPAGLDAAEAFVVAYVQRSETGPIYAAARADVRDDA